MLTFLLLTSHTVFDSEEALQKLSDHKKQVIELLKVFETRDEKSLEYINPGKYIQHNLGVADGLAGVKALVVAVPKETKVGSQIFQCPSSPGVDKEYWIFPFMPMQEYTLLAHASGIEIILQLKGVNYDVGRVLQGRLTRTTLEPKVVQQELEIIKNDLHCNAVKIQGFDVNRLMTAAEVALKLGLDVWLAPEMFEKSQEETFDYTVKAAETFETLRQTWPEKLVLSIGTELMLFMQGILEGNSLMERIGNPAIWQKIRYWSI